MTSDPGPERSREGEPPAEPGQAAAAQVGLGGSFVLETPVPAEIGVRKRTPATRSGQPERISGSGEPHPRLRRPRRRPRGLVARASRGASSTSRSGRPSSPTSTSATSGRGGVGAMSSLRTRWRRRSRRLGRLLGSLRADHAAGRRGRSRRVAPPLPEDGRRPRPAPGVARRARRGAGPHPGQPRPVAIPEAPALAGDRRLDRRSRTPARRRAEDDHGPRPPDPPRRPGRRSLPARPGRRRLRPPPAFSGNAAGLNVADASATTRASRGRSLRCWAGTGERLLDVRSRP